MSASPASALTVSDPGFAVADYSSVSGVTAIAFDAGGTMRTNSDGGIAYVGTHLYAVSRAANEIREVDTAGNVLRVITTASDIACPDELAATDTDLFVTSCSYVYRIRNVNTVPSVAWFSNPGSSPIATHAITVTSDGTVFATAGSNIWRVGLVSDASSHGAVFLNVPDANGIATLPGAGTNIFRFMFITTSTGSVQVYDHQGSIPTHTIVSAGSGGDQSAIGQDGCLYVPQSATVARIANANGTCDLIGALGATPSITLTGGSGDAKPRIGIDLATWTAALANVPSDTNVTFTVVGANPQTTIVPMSATTDRASFTYTATTVGVDTVTASFVLGGNTYSSTEAHMMWYPPADTTPPLLSFSVSGSGSGVKCPGAPWPSDPVNGVYCGWYSSSPTVHWTFSDPESHIASTVGCDDFTLVADSPATGTPVTCIVTNGDALTTNKTVVLQALITPPMISATLTSNGLPYVPGTATTSPVTVTFSCTHAVGPTAIAGCTAPVTITSGDGTPQSITGTATDISGKTASTSAGPIVVDTTGPTIQVNTSYTFGAWTHDDVVLTFTCDDIDGPVACPPPQTLSTRTAGVTVTATDALGNATSLTTGAVNIDKTPPTIAATAHTSDGASYAAGTPTNQNVTVHFTCGTDGAPVTCPADQTVSASATVSGTATDAAGNSASASFVVVTDHTAPTISASVTVNSAVYDGAWTRGPVVVHFTCADDLPGVTCPADQMLTTDRNAAVTATARDAAGNTTSVTTGVIRIDGTAPSTSANVTGASAGTPNTYLFTASVDLTAADAGSGVASLAYTVDGVTTTLTSATAHIVLNTEGAHTVRYHATDAAGNAETEQTLTLAIIFRQHTALAVTSPPFVATDGFVSARLVNTDASTPIAGETITFVAGAVTRTAVTDASGVAKTQLGLGSGTYTLSATYAGTDQYFPSSATSQSLTVFALSSFVVYAPNATLGATVQFWGDDWTKQIADKATRKQFEDFKGFASSASATAWTGGPGDRVRPPASVPQYIAVMLTTHVSKTKDILSGDIVGIAIVRVSGDGKKPYDGKLGDRAYATVVGRL